MDISSLDIAVNAVATAVKDFFFKRLPPVLPEEQMADLETVSSKSFPENIPSFARIHKNSVFNQCTVLQNCTVKGHVENFVTKSRCAAFASIQQLPLVTDN